MKSNLLTKIYLLLTGFGLLSVVFLYQHRPFSTRLAAYATDLSARTPAQRLNIERVQRILSGYILPSGKELSLNHSAGPYTKERGYLPERSFREKGVAMTAGGGVCQFASTLYNAARIAGLQILERVPHSQAVESVPEGMDATVAYGVADLKFKNPYPFPIKITSKIAQDQLRVEVWGKKEPSNDSNSL